MVVRRSVLKPTPLALIEAAERLFGSHGIENVSMRQIRLEAGAGNNSAISYHFNDRIKLVQAIWEHRLPPLEAMRRAMLDDLHARGLEKDPHAVMRVLMMPNYDLRDAHGVHRYAAFFRHALRWDEGQELRNSRLPETPASKEALVLMRALAPDIAEDLFHMRLRHGACTFFDMIVERDAAIAAREPVMEEQAFLAEGMDMLVAICVRPMAG